MKYNYIDVDYYNGYGRWFGKDRFVFPETPSNPLEGVEIENPYYDIVVGFEARPWFEDDTRDVGNQLRCFECTSIEEALKKIKRFL